MAPAPAQRRNGALRRGRRRLADHLGLLFLPICDALGAGGDGAAADRRVRPDARSASPRWSAFSTTATRRSAWSPAWRWTSSARAGSCRSARAMVGVGALLFATGDPTLASDRPLPPGRGGRLRADRRGLSSRPPTSRPSRAATLIGATQMFGMAGGSAGQFAGRARRSPAAWRGTSSGWSWASPGLPIAVLLLVLMPRRAPSPSRSRIRRGRLGAGVGAAIGDGVPQSAVDPLRPDRRADVPPDDHLRHGLGRALPPGGARRALFDGGAALGLGAVRLDHRLPAARLAFRPDRPAQAGDHRRRGRAARLHGADPLRPAGRVPALHASAWSPASPRARRCSPTR